MPRSTQQLGEVLAGKMDVRAQHEGAESIGVCSDELVLLAQGHHPIMCWGSRGHGSTSAPGDQHGFTASAMRGLLVAGSRAQRKPLESSTLPNVDN
jgi:hypothetical protein